MPEQKKSGLPHSSENKITYSNVSKQLIQNIEVGDSMPIENKRAKKMLKQVLRDMGLTSDRYDADTHTTTWRGNHWRFKIDHHAKLLVREV
jgi:hypothetical protein